MAAIARHHGLAGRGGWSEGPLLARHSRPRARQIGRCRRGISSPKRARPGRYRRLRLPPWRRQGADCPREGLRPGRRNARRGTARAARLRQHVGGDGFLRAGADAAPRHQAAHAAQRAWPRLYRRLSCPRRSMSPVAVVVALVALQRLAELFYAARNTRRLKRRGAVEHGRNHYPLFIVLHASWLIAILLAVPGATAIEWLPLALFILLQAARLWIVATLG